MTETVQQSNKMADTQLSFEKCNTMLKCISNFGNICVQMQWRHEFAESAICLIIALIHDKFEIHGNKCDVHKGGSNRPCTARSTAFRLCHWNSINAQTTGYIIPTYQRSIFNLQVQKLDYCACMFITVSSSATLQKAIANY